MQRKLLMPRKFQTPTEKPRWAFPQPQRDCGADGATMNGADVTGLSLPELYRVFQSPSAQDGHQGVDCPQ